MHLQVAARTDIGRVRSKNEDAFIALDLTLGSESAAPRWSGRIDVGPRGALCAVSDGMGGAQSGEVASALVLSSLAQALASSVAEPLTSHVQLTSAVKDAHCSVWAEACARGIEMGATLTALFVRSSAAYVAEVGDSRAYLLRNGRITQLTKDQSYVQMLVDHGAVAAQEAQDLPFRNVILQAMGQQRPLRVALGRLDLRQRDCLLLCSDGLTNEVSDRQNPRRHPRVTRSDPSCGPPGRPGERARRSRQRDGGACRSGRRPSVAEPSRAGRADVPRTREVRGVSRSRLRRNGGA